MGWLGWLFGNMNDYYQGGCCPDCGHPIPNDADIGDRCKNCGHYFYGDQDLDELEDRQDFGPGEPEGLDP